MRLGQDFVVLVLRGPALRAPFGGPVWFQGGEDSRHHIFDYFDVFGREDT